VILSNSDGCSRRDFNQTCWDPMDDSLSRVRAKVRLRPTLTSVLSLHRRARKFGARLQAG
jgi:hypothetical protein